MATRVGAVRALASLLLALAVLAGLVLLLARPTAPGAAPAASRSTADQARAAPATTGEPPATSKPGRQAAVTTRPGPAPGQAADPCRLLTRTEAAAALGRSVARVQSRQGFLVRSCLFSGARGRQLVLQLHQGPAASLAQYRMGRRPDDQPVAGVGDEAWFTADTGLLDVRLGAARFQVGLLDVAGGPAPPRVPPGLVALARAVAGRLPAAGTAAGDP
jgi:hypothetical protein